MTRRTFFVRLAAFNAALPFVGRPSFVKPSLGSAHVQTNIADRLRALHRRYLENGGDERAVFVVATDLYAELTRALPSGARFYFTRFGPNSHACSGCPVVADARVAQGQAYI